jgi:hypothetical protein
VIDKLRSLPPEMAESFANTFAKGADSLLAQQDEKLASRKEFPPMLPEPLVEESPLLYRKGKRRAITGLEIAEEKEMPHGNVGEMRGRLLHLQQLMLRLKCEKKRDGRKKTWWRLTGLWIHSYSSASCRT